MFWEGSIPIAPRVKTDPSLFNKPTRFYYYLWKRTSEKLFLESRGLGTLIDSDLYYINSPDILMTSLASLCRVARRVLRVQASQACSHIIQVAQSWPHSTGQGSAVRAPPSLHDTHSSRWPSLHDIAALRLQGNCTWQEPSRKRTIMPIRIRYRNNEVKPSDFL